MTATPPTVESGSDLAEKPERFSAKSDSTYWVVLFGVSGFFGLVCIAFLYSVVHSSVPAWEHWGTSILTGTTWNQSTNQAGAVPLIAGTIFTTAIALFFAVPIGVGTALALVHLLPGRTRLFFSSLVELLAAVPSVVYGLWGLLVLAPWFQDSVQPKLITAFGGHFPFQEQGEGKSLLLAGVVLFVMVLPLIVALSRDVIAIVPNEQVEGALSVGATKWQVLRKVVLPGARTGIVGAVTLATARALGETVAVALVIGLNPNFPKSLNSPAATISSMIATQFEDSTQLWVAALGAIAVILMAMTFLVNLAGRRIIGRAAIKVGAI